MSTETTTTDVLEGVDLTGKTALVTGASAGLGVETVRALRSVGVEVVGAVRDLDKGRAALGGEIHLVEQLARSAPACPTSICSSTTPG
jgi:NAD(P)-dependent dehydrogenase (short-subunit alcohol dehydrogenase family)